MSYISTKNQYHVALNGVGLLLEGAPESLAYRQGQASIYGQRFASGDRDYNDLSQWWYFMQTDWSGGIKDTVSWANDAKFYYSTNIDTWSEGGTIKLSRKQTLDETFSEEIICGHEGEVAGTTYKFIGTADASDGRPRIYRAANGSNKTFTDIASTTLPTNQGSVSQISTRTGVLWASTVGLGSDYVLATYDGTSWTNQSTLFASLLSQNPMSSRCHTTANGIIYAFVDNTLNDQYALVQTAANNPSAGGDWSLTFEVTNTSGRPISCAYYNGKIHYLVKYSSYIEYWQYDIDGDTRVLVDIFKNVTAQDYGVGDKMMVELGGKLIITIPDDQVWELNGSSLSCIYTKDNYKKGTLSSEIDYYLRFGAVVADNKAWWGNLMYDGTYFYNTWKNVDDATNVKVIPLFVDTTSVIWERDSLNDYGLYRLSLTATSYKGTADKNFLVFSNFDNVAGIDKMGYSVTLLFKQFATSQAISVEYYLGEFNASASWTELGVASAALDGDNVTKKTFFFPANTIFNKIWFRVKLTASGTNTPTMTDLVMEYLPVPTYKKTWALRINAANQINRMDGETTGVTGRELKAQMEQSWWTKSLLDFQDLDYATSTLSGALSKVATTITVANTADFPDKGRLKVDNEEIFYTGKTPTAFTGCVRGARGTMAVAHSSGAVINNAYKVLITDFNTAVPLVKDRNLEYIIDVTLREC